MKRSGPPKRRTPLERGKRPNRRPGKHRSRSRTFSERYPADHPGPAYGPEFRAVRLMPCWLCTEGYEGPGHKVGNCAIGDVGGPTAHHIDNKRHIDANGIVPCGGAAHALFHNRGSAKTQAHFRAWMEIKGYALEEIGIQFYELARGES